MNRPNVREGAKQPRSHTAVIGGYVGVVFGLLAIVSTASEVETPSLGDAALIMLIFMCLGYTAAWVLAPVLQRFFGGQ